MISGFCISTENTSTSVIFKFAFSNGFATNAPITACGEDPVPTSCFPTRSVRIIGCTPSFSEMITANPPRTSSNTGRPFLTWSLAFIPSLALAPPATTRTFLYTPAFTKADAFIKACVGAAQNPLRSEPVALVNPTTSAIAFAKFPPPRWLISPHASSEHSTT